VGSSAVRVANVVVIGPWKHGGWAAAEAWMFETGTNEWHRYDAWPPPGVKSATLFFHPKGRLASAPAAESGAYEYLSDPMTPVPYRAKAGPSIDNDCMTDDQRFAARRPDVVGVSTNELDANVTLAGPGKPTLVRFALPDTNHTFRTGHRIMVQVQSSWFPLADRNPQTFVDIAKATESDFAPATHRILYGGARASSVKITLARGALP
jgi:predicted acyl esterase